LPLHIFEPRYRQMVSDVLAGDRLVGMVLLKPGWERDYEGRPAVYPLGCSGLVTHAERLEDGRYNLVLRGIDRFRIIEEDHTRPYRRAAIERIAEDAARPADRAAIRERRARLEAMLAPAIAAATHASGPESEARSASALRLPSTMADDDLINALAQYLDLEPLEKQALLEQQGLRARAESLV